ncbi:MAG TPA: MotA/TolQ/ExbB proton channel family protein [Spirochaetota bacterium]|nr:MotA/TolQ/ExbB proton channel family protein [Spirochaetota bacterium]
MSFSAILTLVVILPIVGFSVVSLAVIVDKFVFLSKNKIDVDFFKKYFLKKDILSLKKDIELEKNTLLNNLLNEILTTKFTSKNELEEYIDAQITVVHIEYQKRLNYLGIFAKLSTLTGFMGTVLGMIISFNNIVEKGVSTASVVAGGISAALITTAVGLIVAIPITFFNDYFNNKVELETQKYQIIISEVLSLLFRKEKRSNETQNS